MREPSADIEQIVIDYLTEHLEVPVYAEVPNPRPEQFVVVERTGGPHKTIGMDQPLMAIQAWAKTRADAAELAYQVDAVIFSLQDENGRVSYVDRNSMYNYPDEESGCNRYQLVYDMMTL